MPGRPRKPTNLKLVEGTFNVTRERQRHPDGKEPTPSVGIPECPASLSLKAKDAWSKFAKLALDLGTLTVADGEALAGLCETYVELTEARRQLRAGGAEYTYVTTNKDGNMMIRPRPEIAIIQDADRRYLNWLGRFGLTPADRSRVTVKATAAKNDFADL